MAISHRVCVVVRCSCSDIPASFVKIQGGVSLPWGSTLTSSFHT